MQVQAATVTFDGGTAGTGTVINTAVNWSTDVVPLTGDEALFSTVALPSLTTTGSVTFGDLIWNSNNSSAIGLLSGSNSFTISLSGSGGSTAVLANGGVAGDLLLLGSNVTSGTVTIGSNVGGGTGRLNVSIGKAGNFNVVNAGATLNFTGVVGGGFALTKTGAGTLIFSNTNTFGASAVAFTVSAGLVQLTGAGTLGSKLGDLIVNGSLDLGGTNQTMDALSGSGSIYNNGLGLSTLTLGNDSSGGTFSGVISDHLTGTGTIALSKIGTGTATFSGTQTFSGATTVNQGSIGGVGGGLTLTTAAGRLTNSDVTMNGTTLTVNTSAAGTVTRANSVTLNNATFNVGASNTGSTVDVITNALNVNAGRNVVTLTSASTRNTQVTAASLARSVGSTMLVRATSLGANTTASATVNTSNIAFTSAPVLSGSGAAGTTTVGILPWAIGDNSTSGVGTDFLTYDNANGLRRLTAAETVTTFASGNSTADNAKITSAIGLVNAATTLNSLNLSTAGRVNGTGTLTITSGGVLASDNASIGTMTAGTLDFGAAEGVLSAVSGKTLTIASSITGSGGITVGAGGTVVLTAANSYTGGTFLSGGVLNIDDDSALGAVPGAAATNLTFSGGTLQAGAAGIALGSTRNITTAVTSVNANFDTNGNSMSIAGAISGAGGITKVGNGILTLSGNSNFTGLTNANGGTLNLTGQLTGTAGLVISGGTAKLDFSAATAPASNILPASSPLALNTGAINTAGVNTLTIQGKDNAASSQTFSATNIANFASHLNLAAGAGTGTLTVALGAITRTNGTNLLSDPVGATLDITLPATGVTLTTSTSAVNGTLGKGITVNGTTWAALSGTSIIGLANASYSTSFSGANVNLDVPNGGGTLTASPNTVRFNDAHANTVTVSGVRNIVTGATLVTSNVGPNLSLITGGQLAGDSRRDIIFIQNNTAGDLQVDSIITDFGGAANGITKSGPGKLILTANNTIAGVLVANEGTVVVTGDAVAGGTFTSTSSTGSAVLPVTNTTGIFIGSKITQSTALTGNNTWTVVAIDPGVSITLSLNPSVATTGTFTFSGAGGLGASAGTHSVAAGATLQIGNGGTTGSLFPGQNISNNGTLSFNHSNAFTYADVISGTGTVTQAGAGTLTLSGNNTYNGPTLVSAGTLIAGRATNAFGVNSALTVATGADVQMAGLTNAVGSLAGAGTVENANATLATLNIGSDNTSTNFSGTLQDGVGGGKLAITKTGTGTQTFSGAGNLTGNLLINGGTVNISGAFAAPVSVANASVNAVLNILPGAALNATVNANAASLSAGTSGTGVGVINQSGGSVVYDSQIVLGASTGSYGFYNLTGGTLATTGTSFNRLRIGGSGASSVGIFYQTDGAVTLVGGAGSNGVFEVGANQGGGVTNSTGVAYLTGGTVTSAQENHIGYDLTTGNLRGEETIAGTAVVTFNAKTILGQATGDVGILNLNGGVYSTKQIVKGTSGTGLVSFNGGTLKASAAATGASFFTGLTSATIQSGGATIDSNGQSIVIGQVLQAPTGNGVTTIPVSYGGVGYVGAPYVSITGGSGTGATAVANMVDDGTGNGTFKIGSITITNPGNGYSGTPTVTVTGGGGTGVIFGTAATAANVGGGLTKTGTGILSLTGANTYSGGTTVSQGTLLANNATSSTGTGSVIIGSGGTLAGNGVAGSITAGSSFTLQSGGVLTVGQGVALDAQVLQVRAGNLITLGGTVSLDILGGGSSGGLNAQVGNNDKLVFTPLSGITGTGVPDLTGSTLQINTNLAITAANWTAGSTWDLFDWASLSTAFTNLPTGGSMQGNPMSLPDVSSLGLAWDWNNLYTTGQISLVAAIPEPSRALLLMVGAGLMLLRRRRFTPASR